MTETTSHISDDDLEAFVTDLLGEGPRTSLESHVAACEACARRLYAHARAEQAMHELARTAPVLSPRVRWTAAAVAAGLVVAFGASRALHRSPGGDTLIVVYPAGGLAARLFEVENEPVDEPPVLAASLSLFGENP
jgi:anti-sigma factor RsiW